MDDNRQELGARIREARKKNKLTQAQLAEKIGIKRATLSKYESGIIEPSITHLRNIAGWLGVDIDFLLGKGRSAAYNQGVSDGADIEEYFNNQIYELWKQEGYSYSDNEVSLINFFSKLNDLGQQEAVKRVEELTLVPKYQRPEPTQPETEAPPAEPDDLPF